MSELVPFRSVDDYPDRVDGPSVAARMIDGLGFRFHWATEGLREADLDHRSSPETWSIGEIQAHIWGLVNWMGLHLLAEADGPRPVNPDGQRVHILHRLRRLRDQLAKLDDEGLGSLTIEGLPFWHAINGPIADALTHTGQISHLRRAAGNPVPGGISVFRCSAPAD